MAAEGKTTTLANLAVTLSLSGRRVTVVDCDLRRPRVHEFFGLSNEIGFTSVLLGDAPLSAALQRVVLPDGATHAICWRPGHCRRTRLSFSARRVWPNCSPR